MSTQQNLTEIDEPTAETTQTVESPHVQERIEDLVSMGKPTCDVCRRLSPDDRPEGGDFWPDAPTHYVRDHGDTLFDWMGTTVCEFHDTPEHRPDDATHRAVDRPKYVGDQPDRGNSDYLHHIESVEVLDQ